MSNDNTLPRECPFVNADEEESCGSGESANRKVSDAPSSSPKANPWTWRTADSPPSGLVAPDMRDDAGFTEVFSIVDKLADYTPADETTTIALPSSTPSYFRDVVIDTFVDYAASKGERYASVSSVLNVCLAFGLTVLESDPRVTAYYDVRRSLRAAGTDDARFALAQFSHYSMPPSEGYPGRRIFVEVGKAIGGWVTEMADNLRTKKGELALWAVVVAVNKSVEVNAVLGDEDHVALKKLESRMFRSHAMRMQNMELHL